MTRRTMWRCFSQEICGHSKNCTLRGDPNPNIKPVACSYGPNVCFAPNWQLWRVYEESEEKESGD